MSTRLSLAEKHRRKKTLVWNFLLIIALSVGVFLWFYKDFFGTRLFADGKRVNIVFDTTPLILISLDPQNQKAVALVIPADVYLLVPYGYGEYKAGSIYSLGQLDEKRGGGRLVSDAIRDTMGVPIDGYIHFTQLRRWQLSNSSDFVAFKHDFLTLSNIFLYSKLKTNLTLPEFSRFWFSLSGLRSDQFQFINLDFPSLSSRRSLPDGSVISNIDPDALDKKLEGVFEEQMLRRENISIAVFNATGTEGVGASMARLLNHIGSRVVAVGNYDQDELSRCLIVHGSNMTSTHTLLRLKRLFGCNERIGQDVNSQSDVTLILGEKFLQ